jgi:hypothetical protein
MKLRFALISCFILLTACSHAQPTDVGVGGTSAPTFTFSGSGRLQVFEVYENQEQADGARVLTQVWSIEKFPDGVPLNEIGTITFGIVPQGFEQSYPHPRITPSLDKKRSYEYWLWVNGKPEMVRHFFTTATNGVMQWPTSRNSQANNDSTSLDNEP